MGTKNEPHGTHKSTKKTITMSSGRESEQKLQKQMKLEDLDPRKPWFFI
jgi:hypothetical protein